MLESWLPLESGDGNARVSGSGILPVGDVAGLEGSAVGDLDLESSRGWEARLLVFGLWERERCPELASRIPPPLSMLASCLASSTVDICAESCENCLALTRRKMRYRTQVVSRRLAGLSRFLSQNGYGCPSGVL